MCVYLIVQEVGILGMRKLVKRRYKLKSEKSTGIDGTIGEMIKNGNKM